MSETESTPAGPPGPEAPPEPEAGPPQPMLPWGFPDAPVNVCLALVMRSIEHVAKLTPQERGRASSGENAPKYAYRSIDDVLNAVHGGLALYGVLMATEITEWEREPWPHYNKPSWCRHVARVVLTFTGPRGDTFAVEARAEALDDGDKGFGKLISYAIKNALLPLFAIPTQPIADLEIDGAHRPEAGSWADVAARQGNPEGEASWKQHKPRNAQEWKNYADAWGHTLREVRERMGWDANVDTWAKVDKLSRDEKAKTWTTIQVMGTDADADPFDPPTEPTPLSERTPPATDEPAAPAPEAPQPPVEPEATEGPGEAEEAPQPADDRTPEQIEADIEAAVAAAKAARSAVAGAQDAVDSLSERVADVEAAAVPDDAPEARTPGDLEVPTTPAGWRALLPPALRAEVAAVYSEDEDQTVHKALTGGNWSTAVHRLPDAEKQGIVDYLNEPD